ncbi:MAG: TolC family protein [Opitutus sp.]
MNFFRTQSLRTFAGLLFASTMARAESPAIVATAERPPLSTLVEEIVLHHPELKFYEAELDAARAGRRAAGAWSDPELSVQGGRKRVRDVAGSIAGEGNAWSVSVSQTFEWPGRLGLRKSIANRQIELAELGLERFRTALRARARWLAFELWIAAEKSAATAEVAQRYQSLREIFLARDPAGITPLLETRVIEAQELSLKRRATTAEVAAKGALVELNQLRGVPLDAPAQPFAPQLTVSAGPSLDRLLAAAQENNFEFRVRTTELQQQGLAVALARNERQPSVTVSPFVSQERAGEKETVIGLGLSVPLPLASRNRAGVDLAEARRRQAEAMMQMTHRNLEREVTVAAQTFQLKRSTWAEWKADSVEKFRDAAATADRHFRLGAVPLGTYVELQNSYLDAVEALLDTQREVQEAAQQLEQLTGLNLNVGESAP